MKKIIVFLSMLSMIALSTVVSADAKPPFDPPFAPHWKDVKKAFEEKAGGKKPSEDAKSFFRKRSGIHKALKKVDEKCLGDKAKKKDCRKALHKFVGKKKKYAEALKEVRKEKVVADEKPYIEAIDDMIYALENLEFEIAQIHSKLPDEK